MAAMTLLTIAPPKSYRSNEGRGLAASQMLKYESNPPIKANKTIQNLFTLTSLGDLVQNTIQGVFVDRGRVHPRIRKRNHGMGFIQVLFHKGFGHFLHLAPGIAVIVIGIPSRDINSMQSPA